MDRRTFTLGGLAMALSAAAARAAPITPEAEALKLAAERGRLIYALDQAAWVSSDELERRLPDPHAGVSGYVVEPAGGQLYRAVYFRLDGETPRTVFTAEVKAGKVTSSRVVGVGENADLSPLALRMVRARAVAIASASKRRLAPCAKGPFNTVVLPPTDRDGPVTVYLLTPQVSPGEFPFGGYHKFDVASDGEIVGMRPFARGCVTLNGASLRPADPHALGVAVVHKLDPVPTEIHVYLSLWMGRPLLVTTGPEHVWRVDGDHIALIEARPKA
jgi:hypothetical protein